jgi:2-polyprenyl-3-methyl-5-hydroxy-6-metoxy-1,4-benzoquinol methylase
MTYNLNYNNSGYRQMSTDRIQQFVEQHGPWTAMAIKLPDGTYTRTPSPDHRLRRILQVSRDLVGKPLSQCRVLDLACLEGHYGIELALHGCEVVGIEGREASVMKCNFVKNELGLSRIRFFHDDVRNLNPEKYGVFDIIICSGLLYHLPAVDVWSLLQSMYETCKGIVIIDTFIALISQRTVKIDGSTYHGHIYHEHKETETEEEKQRKLWASLENNTSFWFTEPSLLNLIARAGFSSSFDVLTPTMPGNLRGRLLRDRKTYVAVKGPRIEILSSDETNNQGHVDIPEGLNPLFNPSQSRRGKIFVIAKRLLPQSVKNAIKPVLRLLGIIPRGENLRVPLKKRKD